MSFISTPLQYSLLFAIGLVCVKVYWSKSAQDTQGAKKHTSASTSTPRKILREPIQEYYSDQQKKKTLLPKPTISEREDGLESLTEASENGDVEIMRTQEQQPQRQPHRDSTVLRKQGNRRSSSGTLTSTSTIATSPSVDLLAKPTSTKKSAKRPHSVAQEIQPAPSEEAATRRQFLAEMFKDVPMVEIDRVMRVTHWDMDDATAMLAKEDYTWQSVVHRRRSVTSLEATA